MIRVYKRVHYNTVIVGQTTGQEAEVYLRPDGSFVYFPDPGSVDLVFFFFVTKPCLISHDPEKSVAEFFVCLFFFWKDGATAQQRDGPEENGVSFSEPGLLRDIYIRQSCKREGKRPKERRKTLVKESSRGGPALNGAPSLKTSFYESCV